MIRFFLSLFRWPEVPVLELKPEWIITTGMRNRIRTARSRLGRRAHSDARTRWLRQCREKFNSKGSE
jgi:hypothetical protein